MLTLRGRCTNRPAVSARNYHLASWRFVVACAVASNYERSLGRAYAMKVRIMSAGLRVERQR
jgi:hypothetical protein